MPKSSKRQTSPQVEENQVVEHHSEILKLLEPDAKDCHFLTHALDLARQGLHIHPLKPRDKSPITQGWQSNATTDPDIIEQWATHYPTANVGIATGEASGVFIVDCDLRHGADASLELLKRQYGGLPLTWSAMTPNGWHFYFRHPGGCIRNYGSLLRGIEIKGDRGNVVAPGSIHPSGLSYRWQPACSPVDVPLADAPQWLLQELKRKGKWTVPGEVRPELYQVNILGAPLPLGEGSGVVGSLDGAKVRALFCQEEVIQKILPLLGLGGVTIGEKFHCVLHPEKRESAAILRPEKPGNPFMYMDFHEREASRKAFPLTQVYYHLKCGKPGDPVKALPKPTFLVWSLRLLRDAGVIEGVKVDAPSLPGGVKSSVRRVYEGFWDLLSLKFLVEQEPSPYAWEFAASWTGVGKRAVGTAMRWLLGAGFIRFVKHFGSEAKGNRVVLFLLGTRRLVQRLSARGMLERGGQSEIIAGVEAEMVALDREHQEEEQGKRAAKLCKKCGEVWEWVTLGDWVTCLGCYGPLDTC